MKTTTINISNPRIVNVKRFIIATNKNEYLKNLNGELTENPTEAYQFKNKARTKFYGKKFNLSKICTCNVEQLREANYKLEVFH